MVRDCDHGRKGRHCAKVRTARFFHRTEARSRGRPVWSESIAGKNRNIVRMAFGGREPVSICRTGALVKIMAFNGDDILGIAPVAKWGVVIASGPRSQDRIAAVG